MNFEYPVSACPGNSETVALVWSLDGEETQIVGQGKVRQAHGDAPRSCQLRVKRIVAILVPADAKYGIKAIFFLLNLRAKSAKIKFLFFLQTKGMFLCKNSTMNLQRVNLYFCKLKCEKLYRKGLGRARGKLRYLRGQEVQVRSQILQVKSSTEVVDQFNGC